MGCDFSWQVKEHFEDKYANLIQSKQKVEKKSNQLITLLLELDGYSTEKLETKELKKNLTNQLEKIEGMLEEFKGLAQKSNREILSSSESNDNIEPLVKVNSGYQKTKSIRSPVKLDTTESILEDPEIMALINKNRDKFMRKFSVA